MIKKSYDIEALKNNIDFVNDIIKMYVDDKLGLETIARKYDESIHTIRTILQDNNVPMRTKNNR